MCWSRLREEAAAWLYIITDNSNKLDQTVFLDQNKRLILRGDSLMLPRLRTTRLSDERIIEHISVKNSELILFFLIKNNANLNVKSHIHNW